MIRPSLTRMAPTWRRRHAARSRVATASSMKYCSGVGRSAARRVFTCAAGRRSAGTRVRGQDRGGLEVGEGAPQPLLAVDGDELRLAPDAGRPPGAAGPAPRGGGTDPP